MRYYFLGIGGIGMSALARFFHRSGHTVEGYDRTPSPLTESLQQEGISIHFDDRPDALPPDIDLAIYTPAIPDSLQELQALKKRGVPLKKRSQVLGELTRGKCCIAVAGSHGKTSTPPLIAHLLRSSGIGCSAFLGGISKNIGSNLVVDSKSPYIVVEADEYDRSFLQLHPHLSVITATDPDHLDVYGTHAAMLSAYAQFAKQTDADGHLFLHQGTFTQLDGSPYTEEHITKEEPSHSHHHQHEEQPVHFPLAASYSTYTAQGIEADYYAINIRTHRGDLFFDLRTPGGVLYDLQLCGQPLVNIENAVAASAVALMCGMQQEALREGLKSFCGVQRRFDYRIRTERLVYIDDYAHHPAELEATIRAVRFLYPHRRVVGIFQPHLYSRTRDLADDFARVLSTLDELILLPIYPAREQPISGVNSSMVLHKVNSMNKYLCTPEQALELVPALAPDVVLTLGAGDIDRLVPKLEAVLKNNLL